MNPSLPVASERPIILTVGHSNRSLSDFIALLQAHGFTQLVDVRTVPRSRHNPQFNQEGAFHLFRLGVAGENECIREKPWSRTAMNVEQQQALQTHLQAMAQILYEETPAETLKTLGDIEQTVRRHLQPYVMPPIGIFLSSGQPALPPAIRGHSKACSVNCR